MSCCGSSSGCGSKSGEPVPTPEVAFEASDDKPIFISPAAIEAIKNAIAQEGEAGDALRVSVVGGGCSGYQYSLDFDKEARDTDTVLQFDELKILVDPVSLGYLKGTVIDYVSGLNGTGFKFNNPNAKRTCGCGSSFS